MHSPVEPSEPSGERHFMVPMRPSRPNPWLFVGALFGMGAVVGAFAVAPSTVTEQVAQRSVTASVIVTPQTVAAAVSDATFWREDRVLRGDTLAAILARLDVDEARAKAFAAAHGASLGRRQLLPGRTVKARIDRDGQLSELRVMGNTEWTVFTEDGAAFTSTRQPVTVERRTLMKSGMIETSLFAAMDAAGLPDTSAVQLADIFGGEIDFHRDLRRGDRFSVIYESPTGADGEVVGPGRILAAEFVNQGRVHQALYFDAPSGHGSYFTPDGHNLRRSFLRSPLEFSRVTSGFSTARLHPVLGTWMAHKGIDYGAPTGTRIRSAADGIVEFAGRKNGYGNVIVIRHGGNIETLYGHMAGFAPGLRIGIHVEQGDPIGYVGMSGMATGPHLHYEFHVNGAYVDPLRHVAAATPPIGVQLRPVFARSTDPLLADLHRLRNTRLAVLE